MKGIKNRKEKKRNERTFFFYDSLCYKHTELVVLVNKRTKTTTAAAAPAAFRLSHYMSSR
ncbi:hypothetical protein DOY81_001464 [Sarcophaga bullata]|nr:hypothetical protein DOY81_001464 [Sarcophaga bullata]